MLHKLSIFIEIFFVPSPIFVSWRTVANENRKLFHWKRVTVYEYTDIVPARK